MDQDPPLPHAARPGRVLGVRGAPSCRALSGRPRHGIVDVPDAAVADGLGVDHLTHRSQCGVRVPSGVEHPGPRLLQRGQVPRAAGVEGDATRTRPSGGAAHQDQPGREDRPRIGPLGVLEEGGVDRAGGVVDREEDDATTGAHWRGLCRDLRPRAQDLGLGAQPQELP